MTLARIVLLPAGLAVAAAAFVHATAEALPGAFGSASMTTTLNAQALTALVEQGFAVEMSSATAQEQGQLPRISNSLVALARNAFTVDPLEVSTIRTIGLGELLHEDQNRARAALRLGAQLSKRDSITNLWLAQDYAQSGDVEAMTASFDQALRTSVRARASAMTPLVNMLANDESHIPLGELIERRPEWETDFWRTFVRNPVAIEHSARFFERTGLRIERLSADDRQRLYANLKASGQYETLLSLARLDSAAEASRDNLAEGKFDTTLKGDPLGWTTHSEGDYSADVRAASGELQVDARSGSFGAAAERIVRLDRDYRLAIRMVEPVPANATVELAAVCGNSERTRLARIILPAGAEAGEATVAAGACEFANLQLSFKVNPGRQDAFLRVAAISLNPS